MNDESQIVQLLPTEIMSVWTVLLVGVVVLLLALAILKRPVVGLGCFCFLSCALIPNFKIAGVLTSNILLILLTFVATGFRLLKLRGLLSPRDQFTAPPFVLFMLFTVVAIVSIVVHGGGLDKAYQFVNDVILVGLIVLLVQDSEDVELLLKFCFWGCVFVTLAGIALFLRSPSFHFPIRPPDGFYGNRVVLALQSLIGLFLGLALYRRAPRNSRSRAVLGAACFPLGFIVMTGASRGVTFAFSIIAAFVLLRMISSRRLGFPVFLALTMIGIGLSWEEIQGFVDSAIFSAVHVYSAAEISSGRVYLYRAAIRIFPTAPIFGVGWERFQDLWYNYFPAPIIDMRGIPRVNVHCSYLQILVELGIVGFAIFAAWTISYLRMAYMTLKRLGASQSESAAALRVLLLGSVLAVTGLLLHSLFDNEGRGVNKAHLILFGVILASHRITEALTRRAPVPQSAPPSDGLPSRSLEVETR
jgi:O-antigen ligase